MIDFDNIRNELDAIEDYVNLDKFSEASYLISQLQQYVNQLQVDINNARELAESEWNI